MEQGKGQSPVGENTLQYSLPGSDKESSDMSEMGLQICGKLALEGEGQTSFAENKALKRCHLWGRGVRFTFRLEVMLIALVWYYVIELILLQATV